MPLLTPSRIAVVVLSLSLFSFFWTLGFPYQLGQPAQPIIDHYDHKNVHSDPIIPAPSIAAPVQHATRPVPTQNDERPDAENDHRWDDKTGVAGQTGLPGPIETGVAEYEKDGGRWEDESAAAPLPTTLLTHTTLAPSFVNATNATVMSSAAVETPSNTHSSKFCKEVRRAPQVMVIVRTSKAEASEKLSAQLKSLLSCVPHFAIFSDHSGSIDGITIHDALEDIGNDARRNYKELQEYQIMLADAEHKPDVGKTKDLDKWKFLPMIYKAHKMNTSARWYFFIESDTSLSWTNVLQWIHRLDYRIPYYSGSPIFIDSVQTAQRGSGIMLSQGALRRFAKSYDELYTKKWEDRVGKECCGDLALARAMGDSHVEFYPSWPLMQSEQPNSLDYTKKHWCTPAVSWHHTTGETMDALWDAQAKWTAKHGWETPFLYRDAFETFVTPYMQATKDKWDNLSQDTKIIAPQGRQQQLKDEVERSKKHEDDKSEKNEAKQVKSMPEAPQFHDPPTARSLFPNREDEKPKEIDWDKLAETFKDAADSPERCQKSCEDIEDCLQWRYKALGDGECHLGKVLRLGRKTTAKDEPWTSGWLVKRIEKVTEGWACKDVNWKFYQ